PRLIMFSHYPAAATSLDNSPDRLRSARVCVADNCRAGDAATLLSGEQPTGERELGLWVRPKSAEDSARAAVCDCFNAAIPAHCLSANPPSLHYNLSRAGAVTGETAYPAAASSLCKSCRADKNAGRDLEDLQNRFVALCRRLRGCGCSLYRRCTRHGPRSCFVTHCLHRVRLAVADDRRAGWRHDLFG